MYDLAAAQQNLQDQVAKGWIEQWRADNELNRLRGLNEQEAKTTPPGQPNLVDLGAARQNLQQQVTSGGISQAAADAEYARLEGLNRQAAAPTLGMAGGDKDIENALGAGFNMAGQFFAPGSLGRVGDIQTPEQAAALERARIGPIQPNMGQVTSGLSNMATNAANVDPTLQAIMQRREAGLEGLTAPELTALREQGTEGMNRAMQTAMRQANVGNLMAGRSGAVQGAALPGIAEARSRGQAQLERDILLQNVAERNKRLGEYQGLATQIDTDRFARQRASLGDLGAFSQTQQQLDLSSLQNYQNYLQQQRDDQLKRQIFNLGQVGQEKAGQLGLVFGAGQFGSAQQAQRQAYDIAQQNVEAAKKYYDAWLAQNETYLSSLAPAEEGGGEGGNGDSWSSGTSGGNPPNSGFIGRQNPYR